MSRNDPKQLGGDFAELESRRASHRRWFYKRQPKRMADVMAQLTQRRGFAQIRAAGDREQAWQEAIGKELAPSTRIGQLRRGTLEVWVANSLLMQELTFQKESLLSQLQSSLPEEEIKQIRFRVGPIT